jgi:DNA-binding transcriptional LysR family regulator
MEIFAAIVETGSFSRAAVKLYVAQPSLSQQMRILEEELGEKVLFRMRNKKMYVTEAGKVFEKHAQHILRQVQILHMEISALSNDPTGNIRIGIGGHRLTSMLTPALLTFHKTFRNIRIDIVNGTTPQIVELLKNNILDVGVGTFPAHAGNLPTEVLFQEELVVAVREASCLRKRIWITAAEIGQLDLVLFDKTTGTRECLDDFFRHEKITPRIVLELSSGEALQQMVKAGFGATIIPESSVLEKAEGLQVLRIRGKPLVRVVGLVTTSFPRNPKVINELLHLITKLFHERTAAKPIPSSGSIETKSYG